MGMPQKGTRPPLYTPSQPSYSPFSTQTRQNEDPESSGDGRAVGWKPHFAMNHMARCFRPLAGQSLDDLSQAVVTAPRPRRPHGIHFLRSASASMRPRGGLAIYHSGMDKTTDTDPMLQSRVRGLPRFDESVWPGSGKSCRSKYVFLSALPSSVLVTQAWYGREFRGKNARELLGVRGRALPLRHTCSRSARLTARTSSAFLIG